MTPALAASTRRLVGVAAKVDRIIPVTYSDVMARTPSAASSTAPTKTMPNEGAGGRVERLALPGCHLRPLLDLGDTEDRPQGNRYDKWP